MLVAYVDIETTGLSSQNSEITVIGIGLSPGKHLEVIQLVEEDVTRVKLLRALKGVTALYTYNGGRFDLPFIHEHLGVDLAERFEHRDLMFDCQNRGLFGGFKAVERQLGIRRKLPLGGADAVRLWKEYKQHGDNKALQTLLAYNREDIVNLRALRVKLGLKESE